MKFHTLVLVLGATSPFFALLAGCGSSPLTPVKDIAAAAVQGKVFGGQQPVVGATVSVWAVGHTGYGVGVGSSPTALATTTTDGTGSFAFPADAYTCPYDDLPVFITAAGGDSGGGTNANLVLAAGLGACSAARTATVDINEVTTAVTAFALGQFFTKTIGGAPATDQIGGTAAGGGTYNAGLVMANSYTIPTLVNLATGLVNPSSSTMTIESDKLYTIANVLAACVNTTGETSTTETATPCGQLFNYTATPGSSTRPLDTFQAAVQMSRYPYQNVAELYNLSTPSAPFSGGWPVTPGDWTVAVSYQTTAFGLAITGDATARTSSTIDIDATGRVWFPSNKSGANGIGYFDPTTNAFSGPYSTSLTYPQYVAIDTAGEVWATDLQSSKIAYNFLSSPTPYGIPITVANSVSGEAITIDTDNTVLFAYSTTSSQYKLAAESGGLITNLSYFQFYPTALVNGRGTDKSTDRFGYAVTQDGFGGICATERSYTFNNSPYDTAERNNATNCLSGGGAITLGAADYIFSYPSLNALVDTFGTQFTPTVPLHAPEGIATDSAGNEWIANSMVRASVSTLRFPSGSQTPVTTSTVEYAHGETMTRPFGIAVDRSGNVWVSNATCITTTTTPCTAAGYRLSEIIGAAAPTMTPLAANNGLGGILPTN